MGEDPRLIPARAGKTFWRGIVALPLRAHPRACGENSAGSTATGSRQGSSPRVRGKLIVITSSPLCVGLIPARAGKTSSASCSAVLAAAHPRACGENWMSPGCWRIVMGSSPRVRGKRRPSAASTPRRRAHPRACGENLVRVCKKQLAAGSSPRVRGKRGHAVITGVEQGLIPARAGKTKHRRDPHAEVTAHPRACGENDPARSSMGVPMGSSPRVRGKHVLRSVEDENAGLIPARAGKTRGCHLCPCPSAAHPRACGENGTDRREAGRVPGSSPRVRGKPPASPS